MSAIILKFPTTTSTYFTVRKAGRAWAVVLVTPCSPRPIKTTLYKFADREDAIEQARRSATAIGKPVKGRHMQ